MIAHGLTMGGVDLPQWPVVVLLVFGLLGLVALVIRGRG